MSCWYYSNLNGGWGARPIIIFPTDEVVRTVADGKASPSNFISGNSWCTLMYWMFQKHAETILCKPLQNTETVKSSFVPRRNFVNRGPHRYNMQHAYVQKVIVYLLVTSFDLLARRGWIGSFSRKAFLLSVFVRTRAMGTIVHPRIWDTRASLNFNLALLKLDLLQKEFPREKITTCAKSKELQKEKSPQRYA